MFVKYTISTPMMNDAIKMAEDMARAYGFKQVKLSAIIRQAETEWVVTLVVFK